MSIASASRPLLLASLFAGTLATTACDVRDDSETAEPVAQQTATPEASPTPTESETAVASIIRDDALPGPVMELPPEPVRETIPFREGGTNLSTRAERMLAGILESEPLDRPWPIILRGHTDSAGNDRANLRASRARAEAVAAWLVERGVDDERIEVIAMGEQNPIAPNALSDGTPNEEGRARNRRVDVIIAPPPPPEDAEEEDGESPAPERTGTSGNETS